MTASVSRPRSALSIAWRWPGRSSVKPIASRATRAIRSLASPPMDRPWDDRRLHFVGIGGAGMSGLALVAQELGASVSGSDRSGGSSYAARLREAGIEPVVGHDAANVPEGAEVVYSTAIGPDNPERAVATRELHRADLLAELTRLRPTIAVSGTHGKTTTSSMLVHALRGSGADPSYLVGGEVRSTGSNAGWGTGEWLVVEADESDRSLLKLDRRVAVVTNAELDHHSTYSSLRDVEATFREFLGAAEDAVVWKRPELLALADGGPRVWPFGVEATLSPGGSSFSLDGIAVELTVPGAASSASAPPRKARSLSTTTRTTRPRCWPRSRLPARSTRGGWWRSSSRTSTRARSTPPASSAPRSPTPTSRWSPRSIRRERRPRTTRAS